MAKAPTTGTTEMEPEAVEANGSSPVIRILDRSAILEASDIQTEVVEVPEWGGSVIVRGLMGVDRDSFERSMLDIKGKDATMNWRNFRAKLIARSIVDSEGNRIFLDTDVEALGKKSASAISRVFNVAQRLSGMAPEDVEELTSALKDDPSEGSGSD